MTAWMNDWFPLLLLGFSFLFAWAKGFDSSSDWTECRHCRIYFTCVVFFTLLCLSPFIYVFIIKPILWLLTLLP